MPIGTLRDGGEGVSHFYYNMDRGKALLSMTVPIFWLTRSTPSPRVLINWIVTGALGSRSISLHPHRPFSLEARRPCGRLVHPLATIIYFSFAQTVVKAYEN